MHSGKFPQLNATVGEILFLLIVASFSPGIEAKAQIVPDRTLGAERSVVRPNVPINGRNGERIEGGAIRGKNLFHSFSEFNVRNRGAVYFNNPNGIENILSRVTGRNPSNILGTLGVLGNANLFLINPNGIIFGPNGRLDLGGSFIGSTANSILFENGLEFSATRPEAPPLLTINIPIGLQFRNPGQISVRGEGLDAPSVDNVAIELNFQQNFLENEGGLRVLPNKTLALVGGGIDLSGSLLAAPSGRIELGSIADTGSVSLAPADMGFALGYEGVSTYGDIKLSNNSGVVTSGPGGGDIQIRGRRISLDSSRIEVNTIGSARGGTLTVNATESLEIGGAVDGKISILGSRTFGSGDAGEVAIATGRLTVTDGADIGVETLGEGNAGKLTVNASESVEVSGTSPDGEFNSGIGAGTEGDGNAGDVIISTGRLIIRDGGQVDVNTGGEGRGGTLTVRASEFVEVSGTQGENRSTLTAQSEGPGDAGSLLIETGRLTVRDGARVGAEAISTIRLIINDEGMLIAERFGDGEAGSLTVRASELVEVSGTSSDGMSASALGAETTGAGNAGNVTIETRRLMIKNGGTVGARTLDEGKAGKVTVRALESVEVIGTGTVKDERGNNQESSSVLAAVTDGAGDAGDATIETGRLIVRDGGQIVVGTTNEGRAGTLRVNASESVEIGGRSVDGFESSLSAVTAGAGDAGNVIIETGQLIVRDGGQIAVGTANEGRAGTLRVNASESVELKGGSLEAVTDGAGNAGNITIETGQVMVRDGGQIVVGTANEGRAGTLRVNASESVEISGRSVDGFESSLSAVTDGAGDAGNVIIETGQLIVRDGGQIAVGTANEGRAGTLRVNASESVELKGGVLGAVTEGTGDAGNIAIVTERLTLENESGIFASGFGSGNPGSIEIVASEVSLGDLSILAAESATSRGGNIAVEARDIQLRDRSQISAANTQTDNAAAEGNININAETLVLLEGSSIITSAFNPTEGSNINIAAIEGSSLAILKSPDSTIDAVGELQLEGEIEVAPAKINEVEVLTAEGLIVTGCEAYRGSSFVITGRGGLPPNPHQPINGNNITVSWVEPADSSSIGDGNIPQATNSYQLSDKIAPARGWIFQEDGSVLLVDYNTTGTSSASRFPNLPSCRDNS